jgi:hypothetical protein
MNPFAQPLYRPRGELLDLVPRFTSTPCTECGEMVLVDEELVMVGGELGWWSHLACVEAIS